MNSSSREFWLHVRFTIRKTSLRHRPLTLLHSSLIAVEQRVQPGAVVHHKDAASGPLGGHASFPLDVQGHLNRQPSLTLTARITSHGRRVNASSSPRGLSGRTRPFLLDTAPPAGIRERHSPGWCGPLTAAQI